MADAVPNEVTRVVRRIILPGCEKDYDDWLRRFRPVLRDAPGYLSTTVIVPGENQNIRYIVHRFTDATSMEAWENSATRLKLLEEANKYSQPYYEKATGLETWFAIPGMHAIVPPPRWKMALVTFPAAYLLSLFTILILKLISASLPLTITNLIVTTVLVFGLTYFAMPTLSILLKRWLYPL
jgi:hypothetical protein